MLCIRMQSNIVNYSSNKHKYTQKERQKIFLKGKEKSVKKRQKGGDERKSGIKRKSLEKERKSGVKKTEQVEIEKFKIKER